MERFFGGREREGGISSCRTVTVKQKPSPPFPLHFDIFFVSVREERADDFTPALLSSDPSFYGEEPALPNSYVQLSWHRLTILNVTFAELQSIVETNAKQRFALIPAPDPTASTPGSSASHDPLNPAHFLIRATQGHSFSVASENIHTPILITDPDCPDHVVHGTFDPKWKLILKSGGLKPMGRQHVHFALGLPSGGVTLPLRLFPSSALKEVQTGIEPDAGQNAGSISAAADDITLAPPAPASSSELVISGMRATASMLVWVDVKRSLEAGALKWWRSANGVVLTEGDAEGKVGLEWVNRVEKRNGEVVWRGESLGKA